MGCILGVPVAMGFVSCGDCACDQDEAPETQELWDGFVTGEEAPGPVPDGTEASPAITAVSVDPGRIRHDDPILVTVEFTDEEGDIAGVRFGLVDDDVHYDLPFDDAEGETAGALLLILYPRVYTAGYYGLRLSLYDAEGNTGPAVEAPFTILTPDGALPPGDASRDTGSGETDTDSTPDTDTDPDTGTGEEIGEDTGPPTDGPTFLMGYQGNSEAGEPAAIVAVTPTAGKPYIEVVSEIGPRYLGGNSHDYNGRRLAFSASREFWVEGRGPIAVLDIDHPDEVRWVPIPEDAPDSFEVPENRPQLLSDGRVVYQVSNAAGGRLAVWDPGTETPELQAELADLLLAQPEVLDCSDCGVTGGVQEGTFAASPDDAFVYFHLAGTDDANEMVDGTSYLARWNLETGESEVLAFLGEQGTVLNITGDNNYVVVAHEWQWKRYAVADGTLEVFDEAPSYLEAGQTSGGAEVVKGWPGCGDSAGVMLYDLSEGTSLRIIDALLYDDSHKGVNERVQLTADAATVYFMASADDCVTYQSEVAVMSSPITELNPDPELLLTLDYRYDYGLFVLIE